MERFAPTKAAEKALKLVDFIIADVQAARNSASDLSDEHDRVLDTLAAGLKKMMPGPAMAGTPADHPAKGWLDAAVDVAPPHHQDMARAFAAAAPHLDWHTAYSRVEGSPEFDEFRSNYTYAPVAVADGLLARPGPLPVPDITGPSLFLVIQGPGQIYPGHRHPAVEIYGVVAGTADWYRGGEGFRPRSPGEVFVHDSQMVHATTTNDEPTISWAAWFGDLTTEPTLTPIDDEL